MSAQQPSSMPVGDIVVDEDVQQFSLIFANAVMPYVRPEGRFNLEQFAARIRAGAGGTLVLHAPSTREKRAICEVQFATAGVNVTSAIA